MSHDAILRLRIELRASIPAVWRRIEVLSLASFWDLNVATLDAMGWPEGRLPFFYLRGEQGRVTSPIGIPWDGEDVAPAWRVPLFVYLDRPGRCVTYAHSVSEIWVDRVRLLRAVEPALGVADPRCVAGRGHVPGAKCRRGRPFDPAKVRFTDPRRALASVKT